VAGATLYNQGEEVVLFLRRTPVGYLRAAGNGQGKFTITPARRLRANIRGIELVGEAHGARPDGMPLDQFKLSVRRAVERAAARRAGR
jgi:hypothetical protein